WAPYGQHRDARPLQDVCFYSGRLKCGHFIALHLPERVLRQFGFTHTIPRLPSQAADPLVTRDQISAQFSQYLDQVLTPEQRGLAAIYL
ncbi:serine/threonine-protein phosphatase 7 long form-like protein, partial [Trifolium medium]|nr:serine/threonine-protein phosphatase 7 long form-like protein [Trifolium medium]